MFNDIDLIKELRANQKKMDARIHELEALRQAQDEREGIRTAVPGVVSPEKKLYLGKLAKAVRNGHRGIMKVHNDYVQRFYDEHGSGADWPVPNIL